MLPGVLSPLRRLREGEDIVQNAAILDKACLSVMDEIRDEWPNSSTHHFGEDFVGGGEEGDHAPLTDLLSISPFRDETDQT